LESKTNITTELKVDSNNRRLDSFSRLLAKGSGSTCVAVAILDEKLIVAANEFHLGTETEEGENKKLSDIRKILEYFKKVSEREAIPSEDRMGIFKLICSSEKSSISAASYYSKLGENAFLEIINDLVSKKIITIKDYKKRFGALHKIAWDAYGHYESLFQDFSKVESLLEDEDVKVNIDLESCILRKELESGVHAEMQILVELMKQNKKDIYIGISKLCCLDCCCMLKAINELGYSKVLYRGEHKLEFEKNWKIPLGFFTESEKEGWAGVHWEDHWIFEESKKIINEKNRIKKVELEEIKNSSEKKVILKLIEELEAEFDGKKQELEEEVKKLEDNEDSELKETLEKEIEEIEEEIEYLKNIEKGSKKIEEIEEEVEKEIKGIKKEIKRYKKDENIEKQELSLKEKELTDLEKQLRCLKNIKKMKEKEYVHQSPTPSFDSSYSPGSFGIEIHEDSISNFLLNIREQLNSEKKLEESDIDKAMQVILNLIRINIFRDLLKMDLKEAENDKKENSLFGFYSILSELNDLERKSGLAGTSEKELLDIFKNEKLVGKKIAGIFSDESPEDELSSVLEDERRKEESISQLGVRSKASMTIQKNNQEQKKNFNAVCKTAKNHWEKKGFEYDDDLQLALAISASLEEGEISLKEQKEYLNKLGFGEVKDITRDGFCLFHAIADQIREKNIKINGIEKEASLITTQDIVGFMGKCLEENWGKYADFLELKNDDSGYALFLDELQRYLELGNYAQKIGDAMPLMLSDALGISIIINDAMKKQEYKIGETNDNQHSIILGRVNDNHYVVITDKPQEKEKRKIEGNIDDKKSFKKQKIDPNASGGHFSSETTPKKDEFKKTREKSESEIEFSDTSSELGVKLSEDEKMAIAMAEAATRFKVLTSSEKPKSSLASSVTSGSVVSPNQPATNTTSTSVLDDRLLKAWEALGQLDQDAGRLRGSGQTILTEREEEERKTREKLERQRKEDDMKSRQQQRSDDEDYGPSV
jgi:hypothetical protein